MKGPFNKWIVPEIERYASPWQARPVPVDLYFGVSHGDVRYTAIAGVPTPRAALARV
jgi:hypothetical protein